MKCLQPEGWHELPLVPLTKVCSYLPYKIVYRDLSRVCKFIHNQLKYNKVLFEKLEIEGSVTTHHIEKLAAQVSTCKSLIFKYFDHPINNLDPEVLENFFLQMKDGIEYFVWCADASVQALVMGMLNSARRLKTLDICEMTSLSTGFWDWSLHDETPSLENLVVRRSLHLQKLILLRKFPNVRNVSFYGFWRDHQQMEVDMGMNYISSIKELNVEFVYNVPPPLCIMQNVRCLKLGHVNMKRDTSRSAFWCIGQMVKELGFLRDLVLRCVTYKRCPNCVCRHILHLCNSIQSCGVLESLSIVLSFEFKYEFISWYNDVEEMLKGLPIHVRRIALDNRILR